MTEKVCNEFGVTEKMQGITMYCTGCKQLGFTREHGFTCGFNWENTSIDSDIKRTPKLGVENGQPISPEFTMEELESAKKIR